MTTFLRFRISIVASNASRRWMRWGRQGADEESRPRSKDEEWASIMAESECRVKLGGGTQIQRPNSYAKTTTVQLDSYLISYLNLRSLSKRICLCCQAPRRLICKILNRVYSWVHAHRHVHRSVVCLHSCKKACSQALVRALLHAFMLTMTHIQMLVSLAVWALSL